MPELESHQLINQSSGDVEIYTPPEIIAAWRDVLGEFDLDPCSSVAANEYVKAKLFFVEPSYNIVEEIDGLPVRNYLGWGGLDKDWVGKVAMNPPFLLPENTCVAGCKKKRCRKRGWHTATNLPGTPDWINKLEREYVTGRITEACCITFASTSEKWFRPLLRRPQCFLSPRTNYRLPDGSIYKGVTKGSVVTYYGNNVSRFADVFSLLGETKIAFRV